jgi:hypothetical protein
MACAEIRVVRMGRECGVFVFKKDTSFIQFEKDDDDEVRGVLLRREWKYCSAC